MNRDEQRNQTGRSGLFGREEGSMSQKLTLVLAVGLAIIIVAACDQQSSAGNPGTPFYPPAPSSPAAAPLMTPGIDGTTPGYDGTNNRSIWRSGLNNDPNNPSGAPGPAFNTNIIR
jgi:hypothetical protein